MLKNLKSPRRLAALAVFAIIAVSAFGFAASNNFQGQDRAGNGTDTISGYNVSNIHYSLQGNNASYLDQVSFTLNQSASEVQVRFNTDTTPTAWQTCSISGGTSVTCALPADTVTVLSADQLEVSAVS